VQGDATRRTLAEAVHGIVPDGVVARVEAHGVETWTIDKRRGAIGTVSSIHIFLSEICDRGVGEVAGAYQAWLLVV
jgi:hypothetical protein